MTTVDLMRETPPLPLPRHTELASMCRVSKKKN